MFFYFFSYSSSQKRLGATLFLSCISKFLLLQKNVDIRKAKEAFAKYIIEPKGGKRKQKGKGRIKGEGIVTCKGSRWFQQRQIKVAITQQKQATISIYTGEESEANARYLGNYMSCKPSFITWQQKSYNHNTDKHKDNTKYQHCPTPEALTWWKLLEKGNINVL